MKRIGIFIDGSNIYESARCLDFKIDYVKLLNYYKQQGEVQQAMYFTALPPKTVESALRKMADFVEFNGFTLIQKETRTTYNSVTGEKKLKGNMDVEIAVHVMEVVHNITHMVLFSGDGDFRCLVESVQRRGVHVTVVSARELVATEMRRQASEFIDLATLRDLFNQGVKVDPVLERRRFKFLTGP